MKRIDIAEALETISEILNDENVKSSLRIGPKAGSSVEMIFKASEILTHFYKNADSNTIEIIERFKIEPIFGSIYWANTLTENNRADRSIYPRVHALHIANSALRDVLINYDEESAVDAHKDVIDFFLVEKEHLSSPKKELFN